MLGAWNEFKKGKAKKKDVEDFQLRFMTNIISLHKDLQNKAYLHGKYHAFNISDPKPRNIHKASVRDRLLHHAIYRMFYPYFDKKFIADSYSCRIGKGTHKAIERFKYFAGKASKNKTRTCWILKCDIRKFFASIDHHTLLEILNKFIGDKDTVWLITRVISSFNSGEAGKGLPLGNLTSQILVNIYMDEFDQWMKHVMKTKYYIRYADDFVVLDQDRKYLLEFIPKIDNFLGKRLKLLLHPDKLFIKTLTSGVDFLGWVHYPQHRVLRTATKKRMFRNLNEKNLESYFGMLRHGDGWKIEQKVLTFAYERRQNNGKDH